MRITRAQKRNLPRLSIYWNGEQSFRRRRGERGRLKRIATSQERERENCCSPLSPTVAAHSDLNEVEERGEGKGEKTVEFICLGIRPATFHFLLARREGGKEGCSHSEVTPRPGENKSSTKTHIRPQLLIRQHLLLLLLPWL